MMKKNVIMRPLVSSALLLATSLCYAGPLITFTPAIANPPTFLIKTGENATVIYTIKNKSSRPHSFIMKPIIGVTQLTIPGNCQNPIKLNGFESCQLVLSVSGDTLQGNVKEGPVLCQGGNPLLCYQPSRANSLNITYIAEATLTSNINHLVLSVKNPSFPALTGKTRSVTITNTSAAPAYNVQLTNATPLPTGTVITNNCGDRIPAKSSCTFTITPGSMPTSVPNTNFNQPIMISVSAGNGNTVMIQAEILTYGSRYQQGLVFDVNDKTPATESISGKVATGPNPVATGVQYTTTDQLIYGIDETSTPTAPSPNNPPIAGQKACQGSSDGKCDSANILIQNFGVTASTYAAGICSQTINGLDDWYLPSICEMGTNPQPGFTNNCGTTANPLMQNIQQSLVTPTYTSFAGQEFVSATELSVYPTNAIWIQLFNAPPGDSQFPRLKSSPAFGVVCARYMN